MPALQIDSEGALLDKDLLYDNAQESSIGPQVVITDKGAYGKCDYYDNLTDHVTK